MSSARSLLWGSHTPSNTKDLESAEQGGAKRSMDEISNVKRKEFRKRRPRKEKTNVILIKDEK